VISSKITVGFAPETVQELIKTATKSSQDLIEKSAELSKQLNMNEEAVRQFLSILGEQQVPPEELAPKLAEIAERYKTLTAQMSIVSADEPEVAQRKAEALRALERGDLRRTDALLAEIESIQSLTLRKLESAVAETQARRAEIALSRLRYREAADLFAQAATLVPTDDPKQRLKFQNLEADALFQQGNELGDNDALAKAIERYRALLRLQSPDREPLQWASTQNRLGNALRVLGERESGTDKLEQAINVLQDAFTVSIRSGAPLEQQALTLNNLGRALLTLGERESGTDRLNEAANAFQEALKVSTREQTPRLWASTLNNLGNALFRLGERKAGTATLNEALQAFRQALTVTTREANPFQWASTQTNLGITLTELGQRENDTQRLQEAVEAFRQALTESTRERVPLQWASTQNNLGDALLALGEREKNTVRLEQAVEAYREALKEFTPARIPLARNRTQASLEKATKLIEQRKGKESNSSRP
jgi:tetratricopeptide (TPR) repeat protein